jgi:hypothetical protein
VPSGTTLTRSTATTASPRPAFGHEYETFHLENGVVIGPHHRPAGQLPLCRTSGEQHEAFDRRNPPRRSHPLGLPATSFRPKSSDDSMVHENVEPRTVEYESELSETDDLETFAERRSSQTGQHDGDSSSSQLWDLRGYFHMQRVSIPAAVPRLFSRVRHPVKGENVSLAYGTLTRKSREPPELEPRPPPSATKGQFHRRLKVGCARL